MKEKTKKAQEIIKQLNTAQERKILDFELFENKPKRCPYPQNVVRRREVLFGHSPCFLSRNNRPKTEDG